MLSFVRSRSKKGSGRDWWVVPDMPNYSMECILGEALGREFLAYSRRYEREFEMIPSTFAAVVADMVKLGKFTGTELMFVRVVAHAAIGGGR
jgi:hypothetical protein